MTDHHRITNDTSTRQPPGEAIVESFPVGPLQCNCSIIGDPVSGKAIVVDPGGDAERILATLNKHGLQLVQIIHTHAHLDHILASGVLREKTGAPIYLHEEDMFLWESVEQQCQMFGVPVISLPQPDHFIKDDAGLDCCGGVSLHTPGHTPGSVCFWFEHLKLLIAGDTLFQRSIGRTDFPGGDFEAIQRSIKERLFTLDDDATVVTGHGPNTTLGEEKTGNPFVRV